MKLVSSSLLIAGVVLMAACTTNGSGVPNALGETREGVDIAVSKTQGGLGEALLTPLTDLNLRRKEIPQELKNIKTTYDLVVDRSCAGISVEVTTLTRVLGEDEDAFANEEGDGEKAGTAASNVTLSVVSGATGSIIPFSGIVRAATGASSYQSRYNAAFRKGFTRRAYLKGMGQELGCVYPAAPKL